MSDSAIAFRPMGDADLPLFAQWLQQPHVREWWGGDAAPTLDEVRAEYAMRLHPASPVQLYVAHLADEPIGWCQSYNAMACAADGWWTDETDPGVFGIDQFIGEPERLNQGLGARMVRAFAQSLLARPGVTKIQTDPHPANARAIRCYVKAGFRRVREIVTPDGPALLMTMGRDGADLRSYYARRAAEYERVYAKPERQADLRAIEAWLPAWFAGRDVLELACGTGWWMPHGARDARSWLATDINDETLAWARAKQLPACVRFAPADAFALQPIDGGPFDASFAGFWWSHIDLDTLPGWIASLHARLVPGARIVFLDNRYVEGSNHPISRRDARGNTYQQRRLDDGSMHEVLKNFPTRDAALAAIGPRTRKAQWHEWPHYWALTYTLD
jgi:RimJ/RimL family protein N-acetyltransferase